MKKFAGSYANKQRIADPEWGNNVATIFSGDRCGISGIRHFVASEAFFGYPRNSRKGA
jgi:hypothetical protein